MFKLSTKTRYALRAMIELASREDDRPVQLREIARAQGISPKYLEQLATSLRNAGLVNSERGPSGGYRLAKPADQITAYDVVCAAEGPMHILDCVTEANACERSGSCAARKLWIRLGEVVSEALTQVTIADLKEDQAAMSATGAFCYQI